MINHRSFGKSPPTPQSPGGRPSDSWIKLNVQMNQKCPWRKGWARFYGCNTGELCMITERLEALKTLVSHLLLLLLFYFKSISNISKMSLVHQIGVSDSQWGSHDPREWTVIQSKSRKAALCSILISQSLTGTVSPSTSPKPNKHVTTASYIQATQ